MADAPIPEHSRPQPMVERSTVRFVLRLTAVALGILVVWEILLQTLIVPSLRIQQIDIQGQPAMSVRDLLDAVGLEANPLYFHVVEADLQVRLERIPTVRSAKVEKQFPDHLLIVLTARQPLVQTIINSDNSIVLIDEDGVAYDRVPPKVAYDLPVLSGLELRNFTPGTRLPAFIGPFLHDLAELKSKTPALFQAFSEFRLVPKLGQDVEILAYAVEKAVPIRINPRIDAQGATYMLRSLNMYGSVQGFAGVSELDFRAKDIIVKKGER
jgi:hypothetical protein